MSVSDGWLRTAAVGGAASTIAAIAAVVADCFSAGGARVTRELEPAASPVMEVTASYAMGASTRTATAALNALPATVTVTISPGSGTAREADVTGKLQTAFLSDWTTADSLALVDTPVATSAAASVGRSPEDAEKVTGTLLPAAAVCTGSIRPDGGV